MSKTFPKAHLDKDNHLIKLEAGKLYFFDTDEKDVFPPSDFGGVNTKALIVDIPNSDIIEVLRSGRGQVMASVRPSVDISIPTTEAGKTTGYFYEMPEDMGLSEVQTAIYGDSYDRPRGFFEFLADKNPALLEHMISGAEAVEETVKEVTDTSKDTIKFVLGAAASLAVIYILVQAIKK